MKRLAAALLAAIALQACSTTTTINSSPAGAKVYLDGVYRGQTPLTLTLPDGSDNGYKHLRLELEGYTDTEGAIGRTQDGTRLVCGYFCLFPLLWVYKWESSYNFSLLQAGEQTPSPPAGFSPPGPPPPSTTPSQL